MKIVKNIIRKFIDSIKIDSLEVLTDTGWEDVSEINKTIKYDMWEIETSTGKKLSGADNHIVFDENYNEIFLQECVSGKTNIITSDGVELVTRVIDHGKKKHMYDLGVNSENHRYYTNDILSHNSLTSAIYISWYVTFQTDKTIAMLANKHSTAREIFGKVLEIFELLPHFLKPGVKYFNMSRMELDNGCNVITAASSPSAVRGYTIHALFLDEVSFIGDQGGTDFDTFYTSVYPTISAVNDSKIIMVSTPKGMNHFYRLWVDAEAGRNGYYPFSIKWDDVPGRDENYKRDTIAAFGIGGEEKWLQEFECLFAGSDESLIKGDVIRKIPYRNKISTTAEGMNIYEAYEHGHKYVATVDVAEGVGKDYSVLNIFKVFKGNIYQVAMYRSNTIELTMFPYIIAKCCKYYYDPLLVVENNSIGNTVCYILNEDLEYPELYSDHMGIGIRMNQKTKGTGTRMMKELIENGGLHVVAYEAVEELTNFVRKTRNYAAQNGSTDDIVMTMVMLGFFTTTEIFKEFADEDLIKGMYKSRLKELEDSYDGFYFSDGDYEVNTVKPAIDDSGYSRV
jgi:hypothetical protein